jgi:uncharacterized protein Yka (UPF0111/DUF47 family)
MKTFFVCWGLVSAMGLAQADPLSQADLEELRERLKAIEESAHEYKDKRYKAAVDAFRLALQTEDAAMDLYLKCVEQADFIDQQKKSQDFRDWKRDREEHLKTPAFRQALRYQLNWLALTMKAAARPEEMLKLAPDAQEALRAIFTNVKNLEGQGDVLSRSVLDSAFARCFKIQDLPLQNWPTTPLQVSEIYEQVILPPLRKPSAIAALSAAWDARLQMEAAKAEYFSGGDGKGRRAAQVPDMLTFRAEILPNLQWSKQLDLFKNGDQKAAALRMLAHINENMSHNNATVWIEDFQVLVNPDKKEPAAGTNPP